MEPAFRYTGMYSIDAMYMMTCIELVESKLTHLKQLPEGPALGFGQVEWATYLDCVRYLGRKPDLRRLILEYTERTDFPKNPATLIGDLTLNLLIARVKLWMVPERLPSYKDPESQAQYYKRYYNTADGASTIEQFLKAASDISGWIPLA